MLTLTAIAFSLTSCITIVQDPATGDIEERVITLTEDINTLAISSGFDVIVDKTLPRGEVRITTHSDMFDKIDIGNEGSTLNIKLKSYSLRAKVLEVRVPEYDYNSIAISGGADFEWHGCDAPLLTIAASGGADVDLEGAFEELSLAVSGGADIDASGICSTLNIAASGGADLSLGELLAGDVTVTASGGADVEVCALESLTARASGGADVCYSGNPKTLDIEKSGGGSIHAER